MYIKLGVQCRYADIATGTMWRKMRINAHILLSHAPSVTEYSNHNPFMELFANQLRSFNDELMHV